MDAIASQITSLTIVSSIVHSGTYKKKHQSSASLAFVRGIHRWQVNSPHKWPVKRKMFPFDDVIMSTLHQQWRQNIGDVVNSQVMLHISRSGAYSEASVVIAVMKNYNEISKKIYSSRLMVLYYRHISSVLASEIISNSSVCSIVCSG